MNRKHSWTCWLLLVGLIACAASTARADLVITLPNQTWGDFDFDPYSGTGIQLYSGTLTDVLVNATLVAGANGTLAIDLAVYLGNAAFDPGGPLMVGGASNSTAATSYIGWGSQTEPNVIASVPVAPIVFSGTAADPVIWVGNSFNQAGASGTWNGTLTLVGLNEVAAIPEPGSIALMATALACFGGYSLRRRRQQSAEPQSVCN